MAICDHRDKRQRVRHGRDKKRKKCFEVSGTWAEVRLPFELFKRSGRLLREVPRANSLKSIAVVAFGRDHDAKIDVQELGFY